MMPENNSNSNGDNEPLRSGDNNNDDRLPDINNSDAAAENAGETERILEKSRAATSSLHPDAVEPKDKKRQGRENENPPTTQGSEQEIEENLSGTTNLTIEQLKKEGDPGGYPVEGQTDNQ